MPEIPLGIKLPNLSSQSTEFHHLFFCAASTGITESNRTGPSIGPIHISKLNFASGRTGRTAGPANSTLVKLSLINHLQVLPYSLQNILKITSKLTNCETISSKYLNISVG